MVHLPVAPLMHGATQWGVMGQSFVGSKIVLMAKFDPHEVWRLVGDERVNSVMITGDAMGKPLVESLDEPGRTTTSRRCWPSSRRRRSSPPPVKDQFFERLPNLVITDAIGSSEGGNNGMTVVTAGNTAMKSGPDRAPARARPSCSTRTSSRSSPARASSARSPARATSRSGYYNDPKKTAEVFIRGARDPLRHAGRLRHRRGGRLHHAARPRLDRHQLGRREDLPRRGRVGRALASRRDGRHRVRRARRALGPDGGAPSCSRGRARRPVARVDPGALPGVRSPATSCPAASTSSTRSSARPSGKPDYTWAAAIVNAGAESKS